MGILAEEKGNLWLLSMFPIAKFSLYVLFDRHILKVLITGALCHIL